MYHQFNFQQFYFLPTQCIYVFCVDLRTQCIYVFCVDLRTNSDYSLYNIN